jgi:glutamine synthetase
MNISIPMAILNTAVARAMGEASNKLRELLTSEKARDKAIIQLIKWLYDENKSILYSGNNYSPEWRREAKKRHLPEITNVIEAFDALNSPPARDLLAKAQVLSDEELASHANIYLEHFYQVRQNEVATLRAVVVESVIPALERQIIQTSQCLANTASKIATEGLKRRADELENCLGSILASENSLRTLLEEITHGGTDFRLRMTRLQEAAIPDARKLAKAAENAEALIASDFWNLPRYRELLYSLD